jgi:hypothetical protein
MIRGRASERTGRDRLGEAVVKTPILCGCGRVHTDPSTLTKVGWQPDGGGGAALLVNCSCDSTLVAEKVADACLCMTCRRLVTGSDGDVKTCVWDEQQGPLVMCGACFRLDARRSQWLEWDGAFSHRPYLARVDVRRNQRGKAGGGSK